MERQQVIGLDVKPGVGQRVIMANTRDRWRGEGAISSVHASGSYCGVQWDSGHLDVCLFTGMQNEYHLLAANCVGQDGSGHLLPLDQVTAKAALPEGYDLWLPRDDTELQESFNTYAHRTHMTITTLPACPANACAPNQATHQLPVAIRGLNRLLSVLSSHTPRLVCSTRMRMAVTCRS